MKICFPDHDIIELINFILDSFNQSNGVPNFFIYLSIAFDTLIIIFLLKNNRVD